MFKYSRIKLIGVTVVNMSVFQVWVFMLQEMYIALCTHHPESNLSPYIRTPFCRIFF